MVKIQTQNAEFVRLMPNEEDPYILINLLTTHLQIVYIFGYKGSWRTYYAPTSFFVKKVTEYNRERRCDCKGFVKSHERIFPIIIGSFFCSTKMSFANSPRKNKDFSYVQCKAPTVHISLWVHTLLEDIFQSNTFDGGRKYF